MLHWGSAAAFHGADQHSPQQGGALTPLPTVSAVPFSALCDVLSSDKPQPSVSSKRRMKSPVAPALGE